MRNVEQEFIDFVQKLVDEHGRDILEDKAQFDECVTERIRARYTRQVNVLEHIMDAHCVHVIGSTGDNVTEEKTVLLKHLEDVHGLSPKATSEILDLLGLVLCGDNTNVGGKVTFGIQMVDHELLNGGWSAEFTNYKHIFDIDAYGHGDTQEDAMKELHEELAKVFQGVIQKDDIELKVVHRDRIGEVHYTE